jgi:hypothetical protein
MRKAKVTCDNRCKNAAVHNELTYLSVGGISLRGPETP